MYVIPIALWEEVEHAIKNVYGLAGSAEAIRVGEYMHLYISDDIHRTAYGYLDKIQQHDTLERTA